VQQRHDDTAVRHAVRIGVLRQHLVAQLGRAGLHVVQGDAQFVHERDVGAEVQHGEPAAGQPTRALTPPSTASHCPVMCLPASLAYSSVMPLRSSSSPRRPSGACAAIFSSPMVSISTVAILVLKKPGQMALTPM